MESREEKRSRLKFLATAASRAGLDRKVERYAAQEIDVRKFHERIVATRGKTLLLLTPAAMALALP